MAKETNIDSMKYRKSTHLAGIDIETIIADKGKCIVTIKEAFYDTNVDVSGNKTSGYFLQFVEDIKPMVANSGNRKTIGKIVKDLKNLTNTESRNIGNWTGVKIELVFDENVKMMGQKVGGIKVVQPSVVYASDVEALKLLSLVDSKERFKEVWSGLTAEEKKLPTVLAVKDSLIEKFK